jgi:hypothetical protein
MTTLQTIVSGWVLLGLIGTILSKSKKIFSPPKKLNMEYYSEEARLQIELGREMLKKYPLLDFCIELFLGLLYVGQWNFVLFLWWAFVLIPIHLIRLSWWHIKNNINLLYGRYRIRKMIIRIMQKNPSYEIKQAEMEVEAILMRSNRMKKRLIEKYTLDKTE